MLNLSNLAFILIVVSAMVILIFRDWRINAASLAAQYLAVFVLVTLSWPIGLSIIKLIVGWMATAALALTCIRQLDADNIPVEPTSSLVFRGLAGLFVIMVVFVLAPTLQESMFPRVDLIIIQSGIMLLGMALMQLGTSSDPYLNIISLLSLLAGFELIHAALELSTLLTGLLVLVNLGLALVGVYFITKANDKEQQQEQGEPQ